MSDLRQYIFRLSMLLAVAFVAAAGKIFAFSPEHYAQSSRLATGNWAKIEVKETGLQFLSDATIRNLGFLDPGAINIFGYGGVAIPENLDSPDDLPLVPSLRVEGGYLFFGKDATEWQNISHPKRKYSHISHPYSDRSYYFISDVEPEHLSPIVVAAGEAYGSPITEFTQRLLHEQELSMPIPSGRLVLGEDFKTNSSRDFSFHLPGNVGDAVVTTVFACDATGLSTLVFTANGNQLEATTSDRLPTTSAYIQLTTSVKKVANPGEALKLNIKFNGTGKVNSAGLDFIEVEYPRQLAINDGELYFYLNQSSQNLVKVEGATPSTKVWDVTDALNPHELTAEISDGALTFVAESGYHEYVAFDPSFKGRTVNTAGGVKNQDIHSMEAPGMLVICPEEYTYAARRLESIHSRSDGLSLAIITPEEIYNEFSSGKPDVSAFRKLLKMWYDRAAGREGEYTEFCLIMSRPTYDNKLVTPQVRNSGYPRVPIWQSVSGYTNTSSFSTDDYIGMLEDVNGSFDINTAKINVAVGRMPFKNLNEANLVIDKLEKYVLQPEYGSWRNNVMVIADDQDSGVHLNQAENAISSMKSTPKGSSYLYEKLYLDAYPMESASTGNVYPLAHQRMMNRWNEGTAYINYIGHANTTSWGHESLLTWTDINNMSNSRLPYIYAATCEFLRWDDDDVSGAEILWLLPNSGAIGLICPSREVLISSNGVLNAATSKHMFRTDSEGKSLPIGTIMINGKNDSNTGNNKLKYGLIGDPSMRVAAPELNVVVETINGIPVNETDRYPVIQARSEVTIQGMIRNNLNLPVDDFSGIVELTLYDAEKVITTNGNGTDGVVSMYNDRKTRLFVGRTKVENGRWSIKFTMPSEIENNYSPALLSAYAYDENGREGNGACEKLYTYGYDETAPDDFEGPKIIEFYLNNPGFTSGSQVGPNPVLTARFYDESGISVSEAGIGHSISLDLDDKTFFDDVDNYYIPDENDSKGGSLSYTLKDVDSGKHTLRFTVWDNANNSSTATLDFNISALWKPSIQTLTTDVNPATSGVNFIVATDGITSAMDCAIEVYDLWGRKIWREKTPAFSGNSRTELSWDLCDFAGARIPAGIYLYKAIVKTENGVSVAKTKKLLVR